MRDHIRKQVAEAKHLMLHMATSTGWKYNLDPNLKISPL